VLTLCLGSIVCFHLMVVSSDSGKYKDNSRISMTLQKATIHSRKLGKEKIRAAEQLACKSRSYMVFIFIIKWDVTMKKITCP
jgi:hypothetical protein